MEETFKCHKCGKKVNEVWLFGEYGNNKINREDDGEYCEECFVQLEGLHSPQLEDSLDESII